MSYWREKQWLENGTQLPLNQGHVGDLPSSTWIGGDVPWVLQEKIRRIDPDFKIIYDRLAAPDSLSPSHFLIRITRRGGTPAASSFVLEFPLQYDIEMEWPHGTPRAPGEWVLDAIKQRWKANLPGETEEEQHDHLFEDIKRSNCKRMEENAKPLREADGHIEEMTNDAVKMPASSKRRNIRQYKQKNAKKTKVRV